MSKTALYIKTAPEHAAKLRKARAYKRAFGGICGAMTWRELALISGAGKPRAKTVQRAAVDLEPKTAPKPAKGGKLGRLGALGRMIWQRVGGRRGQ